MLETLQPLNEVGLKVKDVVVLVDREQGGEDNLKKQGLILHSVIKITEMMTILEEASETKMQVITCLHSCFPKISSLSSAGRVGSTCQSPRSSPIH